MTTTVDATQYTKLNFTTFNTLQDKINALFAGSVLFIKNFEQTEGADVLIQLVQNKFTVTQISYNVIGSTVNPRYWVTFNVGINDLSLLTAFLFEEELFSYSNKFMINDTVLYTSTDSAQDTALITGVYVNNNDSTQFAYSLTRDPNGLYAEADLMVDRYL